VTGRWSAAPGMHLAVWVGAQGRDRVQRAAVPDRQPLFRATVGAVLPRLAQQRGELSVRRSRAQPLAYRHNNQVPSAVSRLRSQARQNGAVVEAMMPKVVPSASRNRSAGARPSAAIGSIAP